MHMLLTLELLFKKSADSPPPHIAAILFNERTENQYHHKVLPWCFLFEGKVFFSAVDRNESWQGDTLSLELHYLTMSDTTEWLYGRVISHFFKLLREMVLKHLIVWVIDAKITVFNWREGNNIFE